MPDTGANEEGAVRNKSLDIVAKSEESPNSFASCTTCLGPNRTPIHHADVCMSADPTDDDADVKGKAASSSSSSELTEEANNDTVLKFQRQLSLEVPAEGESATWSSALKGKGKRKADDTEDPPSVGKKNLKPAVSTEADVATNQECPEHVHSAGTGICMLTLHQVSPSASNPDGIEYPRDMANGSERGATPALVEMVTIHIPGFALETFNHEGDRMLTSYVDERYALNPEGLSLEELDILRPWHGDEEQRQF